jgi:phosphoglycolate phosphatase
MQKIQTKSVRRFDLLVFDWDGTLMDSTANIAHAIQSACSDIGHEVPTREQAQYVIGLGLQQAVAYLCPQLTNADYDRLIDRYRYHYLAKDSELCLFEGVREALEELMQQGFLLAVATGKNRAGLNRVFEATGMGKIFHSSRCADETFSKPHPGMLLELMDEMGVSPAQTLMVGDTTHDLQMAINAGVASLAVSHGAHSKQSLLELNPLYCCDNFLQVREWLLTHA